MDKDSMKAAIETYIAAYNSFDIEGMIAGLHPEIEFCNVSEDEITAETNGVDEFEALARQSAELFSSRDMKPTGYAFEGDSATVDISYSAVLRVDLADGLQSGDRIELTGQTVFRFVDGKIAAVTDIT